MDTDPTPDEAREALLQVERRRAQTAAAAGWPRWSWIAAGALIVAYGVLADQQPDFLRNWGSVLVLVLLLLAALTTTRRGSALIGRPVRSRTRLDTTTALWGLAILVTVVGGGTLASVTDVPHVALWFGIAAGILLAAGGPWWQHRVLTRGARR
ncbi:hypothetical protein [Actinoplanes sp. NPDC020271]|uniref:hypothetical protein n=1 Tax=Actinoplanes sp. NPDC020271 TaxID=3363896 RepID=UPI0037A9E481